MIKRKINAFTLAEVLITLGIIGVVAAITMPVLGAKTQDMILNNQFKKAYNILTNMVQKTNADLEYAPECYIWLNNPYSGQWNCDGNRNSADICTRVNMNDSSDVPSDIWGRTGECSIFWTQAMKNLKIVKKCQTNGGNNNCFSSEYKGYDKIKVKNYENLAQDKKDLFTSEDDYAEQISASCTGYRANRLGTRSALVLQDGITIIGYGSTEMLVDINGQKGPNKWGYDLYQFRISGDVGGARKINQGSCMAVEDGGHSTTERIQMISKK